MWKISEQAVMEVPDKGPPKKKIRKILPSTEKSNENNSENENVDELVEKTQVKEKKTSVPKDPSEKEPHDNKKTLYPYYSSMYLSQRGEDDLEDCIKLTDILSQQPTSKLDEIKDFDSLKASPCVESKEDILKFGLFADQLTAVKMSETQGELHKAAKDGFSYLCTQMAAGNTQTAIQEAADKGSLTQFLVSLAPSVSYSFWLKICEKYAAQLISDHTYIKAAFYYLACGKVHEAISLLADKGYYVDALAISKARLPSSDPVFVYLYRGLIKKFCNLNRAVETMSYLSLNEVLSAAKAVAYVNEPKNLRVAAYICRKFKLDKEADEYMFLCLDKCLVKYDYKTLKLLLDQEPCLKVYSVLVAVHQALHHHIEKLKPKDFIPHRIDEMFGILKEDQEVCFWKGSTCLLSGMSFTAHAHLQVQKELPEAEKPTLVAVLEALNTLMSKRVTFGVPDVPLAIAIHVTKFIVNLQLENKEDAIDSFMKIFEISYDAGLLPKIMFSLFFPMCLSWQNDANYIMCESILNEKEGPMNLVLDEINQKAADLIISYTKQTIITFIEPNDLQDDLNCITNKIAVELSTKSGEEFFLAYFVSSFISDLVKLLEKSKLKRNFCAFQRNTVSLLELSETESTPNSENSLQEMNSTISDKSIEDAVSDELKLCDSKDSIAPFKNVSGTEKFLISPNSSGAIVSEKSEEKKFIDELINLALEEADKKAMFLAEQAAIEAKMSSGNSNEASEVSHIIESYILQQVQGDTSLERALVVEVSNASEASNKQYPDEASVEDPKIFSLEECLMEPSDENTVDGISGVNETRDENLISDDNVQEVIKNDTNILSTSADLLSSEIVVCTTNSDDKQEVFTDHNLLAGKENSICNSVDDINSEQNPEESNVCENTAGGHATERNSVNNETDHAQCVQSIDIFYNVVSFVAQNICKDEFALLYYLKKKVKSLNDLRASKELNKFSKEKADMKVRDLKKSEVCVAMPTSRKSGEEAANSICQKIEDSETSAVDIEKTIDPEQSEMKLQEVGIVETRSENVGDKINDKIVRELIDFVVDHTKSCDSISDEANENAHPIKDDSMHPKSNKEVELLLSETGKGDSSAADPGTCKKAVDDRSGEEFEGSVPEVTKENNDVSAESTSTNLQIEIEEMSELINILEKSTKFHYPNPFDVVQRVLKALYFVIQKCSCEVVEQKLHAFIHELVFWNEQFCVGKTTLACRYCKDKCAMK